MSYVSQITPAPTAVPVPAGYSFVPTRALAQAAGPMLPHSAAWPYTGGLPRHRIRRGPVVLPVSAGR